MKCAAVITSSLGLFVIIAFSTNGYLATSSLNAVSVVAENQHVGSMMFLTRRNLSLET